MTTTSTPTVESFSIVCGPASSQPEVVIAVGLFDPSADRLFMRFRPDLLDVISEEEMDVISATEEQFLTLVAENGATATVQWMEETLSNFVRFDGPKPVERPNDFEAALDGLYDHNINPKTRAAAANRNYRILSPGDLVNANAASTQGACSAFPALGFANETLRPTVELSCKQVTCVAAALILSDAWNHRTGITAFRRRH